MKRVFSLLLSMLLFLLLSVPAYAAPQIEISPQSLRVDGRIVNCEKYNIDGYNYIRLRDLAALVSDTDSRFSVGYDQRYKLTKLVPGEEYVPDGSELMIIGDRSDTAVETKVTLLIGDEQVDSISVFQIGTSLYFKLRDIAPYVHVNVEYDALRAMILLSTLTAAEKRYVVREVTQDASGSVSSIVTRSYDGNAQLISEVIESAEGTETHDFAYDLAGLLIGETVHSGGIETCLEYLYDANGNLTSECATLSTGDICQIDRVYDELGRVIQESCVGSADDYLLVNTYDDMNMAVAAVCSFVSGAIQSSDITLDIAGNAVAEAIKYVAQSYQSMEEIRRTFDAYGNVLSEISQFTDSEGVTLSSGFSFDRDSAGNPLRCLWSDGSVTEYTPKTASELSASAASAAASGGSVAILSASNTGSSDSATRLESTLHHVHYLNMLTRSGNESIKYLGSIAASRMTDRNGKLLYIYTNKLFGCKASFTFYKDGVPTMTGKHDLLSRVLDGTYSFSQDIGGLEGIWLSGSEVKAISADRARVTFNTDWDDAEWAMIRSCCPSPDAYYLFTYDRGADGVLRARYLIPDALNISDSGKVICLTDDSTFGSVVYVELGLTEVTIAQ